MMTYQGFFGIMHRVLRSPQYQITFINKSCCTPVTQTLRKVALANFSSFKPSNELILNSCSSIIVPLPLSICHRNYAVKKGAKKKDQKTTINITGLKEYIEVEEMMEAMQNAVDDLKTEMVKSLSLRSAGTVESIKVEFEGKEYEIQQIAKLSRKGQQTIVIDMLSFPQMTKSVVDTLKKSSLNLNPQQEGTTVYVPIPKVTKEHRETLAKKAKSIFIKSRDTIKQIQEQHIRILREAKGISDSERDSAYRQVRSVADKYVSEAEAITKAKQEELLGK